MDYSFEEEYYRDNYPDYLAQNPRHKLQFYRRILEKCVQEIDKPNFLEMGCAFGYFLRFIDPGWMRYGFDVSEHAIGEAQKALPDVKLWVGSATDIPYKNTFHAIAAFDVIEHVSDLKSVSSTVSQALAPLGYFLFVVPVYDGPTGPIIHKLDKDPTHVHKTSRRFWLDWVQKDFDVIEWWGIYRYLFPLRYYLHWPTRLFRNYTPAIAVLARARK